MRRKKSRAHVLDDVLDARSRSLKSTPSTPPKHFPTKRVDAESKDDVKKALFTSPHSAALVGKITGDEADFAPWCDSARNLGDMYDSHLRDVVALLLESEGMCFIFECC